MRTLLRNCSYSVALVHILLPASCHLKASLWALFSSSSLNNSPETKLSGSPSVSMYVLCLFSFLFVSTLSSLSNTSPSPLAHPSPQFCPPFPSTPGFCGTEVSPRGWGAGARHPAQKSPSQVWRGGITNLPTARPLQSNSSSSALAAWKSPHKQHTGLTAQWKELRLALCRLGR